MAWRDLFRGWGRKSASSSLELFREIYGRLSSTKAGASVNLETAIKVSAVFGCCRVRGNGLAQTPLKLMRQTGRTRVPAVDHPLYNVLARRPNPWQTSFEFRQMLSWHADLAGNFYAYKNAPAGRILELLPFDPSRMLAEQQEDGSFRYEYTRKDGSKRPIPADRVWHYRGPTWHVGVGLAALSAAREAVGLAIVTEESQSALHSNGVRTTGGWSVEGKLNPTQFDDLQKWIEKEHAGAANAGRPFIMDRAAKWVATQMSGVDAQHLETRRHQIEEVCRFFNVMPIMVGYSDKAATYASAEQMFLAHVEHTLSPLWTSVEQSMDMNLLTKKEIEEGYYFDFVEEGMKRGSMKDTKDTILGYVNGGVITPNEGRALLDLNPDPDPASDRLRIPVNTVQPPEGETEPPAA